MSSRSLPSMRVVLFSVLGPQAIQAMIEKLESLNQHVLLLVVSPGTSKHPIGHYQQIVAGMRRDMDVLVTSHMQRLPAMLQGLAPDLILVAGFPRKLPSVLLDVPRLGCVNWHPSLLPRYRGPEPIFWQFMQGDTHAGLTFHRMDDGIDTGPILVQRELEVQAEDDMNGFFSKLLMLTLEAIPEVLQAVAEGDPGIPQPVEGGSYAPHCTEADRQLDWARPAIQLQNQVQIWSGSRGAYADVEGQRLLIRHAQAIKNAPHTLVDQPGSVLKSSSEGIVIQTGQDALLIQNYSYETEIATV